VTERILGIWDGHDAGVAVLESGCVRYAANEERFSRRKLEVGFPARALKEALAICGAPTAIAVSTSDPAKTLARLLPSTAERYYRLRRHLDSPRPLDLIRRAFKSWITSFGPAPGGAALASSLLRSRIRECGGPDLPIHVVDHHAAHLASAWRTSGFESATVVSLDGVGDGVSGVVGVGDEAGLREIARFSSRDSIGLIFEEATRLLGLRELEDEGKVMALASHADLDERSRRALEGLIVVETGNGIRIKVAPAPNRVLRAALWKLGPERFAAAVQSLAEDAVVAVVSAAVRSTGVARVAVAGGVFANVRVNRLVREMLAARADAALWVFPHMGDGGLAVGAALCEGAVSSREETAQVRLEPYLGTEIDAERTASVAREKGLSVRAVTAVEIADRLVAGSVIGWLAGRMEFGPRALGARSILARPDDSSIRDRLNLACKKRVFYQPFCPVMLSAEAAGSLANYDGRDERWMTSLYGVTPDGAKRLAGTIGPDRSCRPQILAETPSTREERLLREVTLAFESRSGIGALLNTSFNVHGEPVARTGEDALGAFLSSELDELVVNGRIGIKR
jgi:carbamoyltransferase